jgi:hypothetical protein
VRSGASPSGPLRCGRSRGLCGTATGGSSDGRVPAFTADSIPTSRVLRILHTVRATASPERTYPRGSPSPSPPAQRRNSAGAAGHREPPKELQGPDRSCKAEGTLLRREVVKSLLEVGPSGGLGRLCPGKAARRDLRPRHHPGCDHGPDRPARGGAEADASTRFGPSVGSYRCLLDRIADIRARTEVLRELKAIELIYGRALPRTGIYVQACPDA